MEMMKLNAVLDVSSSQRLRKGLEKTNYQVTEHSPVPSHSQDLQNCPVVTPLARVASGEGSSKMELLGRTSWRHRNNLACMFLLG